MDSWLHAAAAKHPDRLAVESPERTLSYDALARLATSAAGALEERGVGPDDRVALEIEDRIDFVVALQACLLIGAPAVPIDLRLSESERKVRRRGSVVALQSLPAGRDRASAEATRGTDAVATVMHPSGTTSEPKAIELTYANWLAGALGSAVALGLDPGERW